MAGLRFISIMTGRFDLSSNEFSKGTKRRNRKY